MKKKSLRETSRRENSRAILMQTQKVNKTPRQQKRVVSHIYNM